MPTNSNKTGYLNIQPSTMNHRNKITARVAADFYDMGLAAGKYLVTLQPDTSKAAKVAWFPGPAGAAWGRGR